MPPGWGIHLQKGTTKPWHLKHLINATKCHSINKKKMFSPTLYLWGEQITSARSTELTRARGEALAVLPHKACSLPQGSSMLLAPLTYTDNCWLSPHGLILGQITFASVTVLCSCPAGNRGKMPCSNSKAGRMKIRVHLKSLA